MARFGGIPVDEERKPRFGGVPAKPKPEPDGPSLTQDLAGLAMQVNPAVWLANGMPNATGLAAQFQQGTSFGWADELNALKDSVGGQNIGNLVSGQSPYETSLSAQSREREQYERSNPVRANLAELTGAMLGPAKLGAVKAGQGMVRGGLKLAGVGATAGALSGAGTADPGNRSEGALGSAIMGGLLGPIAGGAMKVGGDAFKLIRNALSPKPQAADEALLAALGRDGMTPADLAKLAGDAPKGVPTSLADAGGQNAKSLLSGMAVQPGQAQRVVVDTLESRLADQGQRVREAVSKSAGPRKYAVDLVQEVKGARWAKAAPLYDEAFKAGRVGGERVAAILKDHDVSGAYATAQKIAARENIALQPLDAPDLRTLDYVKRALDGTIDQGFRSGNTANAASLKKLRNELVGLMDEQSPAYKAARRVYSGDSEVLEAIEQGQKALNMGDGALKMTLRGFKSDAEKEAFRKAALDALSDRLNSKEGASLLSELLSSEKKRRNLKLIVGEENYPKLTAQLLAEKNIRDTGARVNPRVGSATAMREGDAGSLSEGGAGALQAAATGNAWGLALHGLRALKLRGSGLNDDARGRLASNLMTDDRAAQQAYIKQLEKAAREQAARQLRDRRRMMGAGAAAGAVPGLLGE